MILLFFSPQRLKDTKLHRAQINLYHLRLIQPYIATN